LSHALIWIFRWKSTDTFSTKRSKKKKIKNKKKKKYSPTRVGVLPRPQHPELERRILHIFFIEDIFDVISHFWAVVCATFAKHQQKNGDRWIGKFSKARSGKTLTRRRKFITPLNYSRS